MARKTTRKGEEGTGDQDHSVNEPQPTYHRASVRKTSRRAKQRGYDAKRSAGMIPGLAERMKTYLKTMRDDR